MSPSKVIEPSFTLTPMKAPADKKYNFGAVVTDIDLNNINDEDVQALKDAIWTYKVVVVRGQKDLQPIKQWELVTRWDPDAQQVHSHGDLKSFQAKGGLLSKNRDIVGIPGAENVRIIGKGHQGADHYGIKDLTISRGPLHGWHLSPPTNEQFAAGHTRFQRWHIDAPLYARDPAWFTTLRCIKRPSVAADGKSRNRVTIHWDDGSGRTMDSEPGLTAFFSNVQTYELMTDEEKQLADHSWVEYAPYPYQWISECKSRPTGLGLASQGREKKLADLGDWRDADVKRYPMVWVNPVTGERAFQVHGICVRRMFLRRNEAEAPRVVDDLDEIRAFLRGIQERVLRPEYIMIPVLEEGDVAMWANWQTFHSAVDYPDAMGDRTMHQANIGASSGPEGPVKLPPPVPVVG